MPTTIDGDLVVRGTLSSSSQQYPAGSIQASDIVAAAGIEATKLQHQHAIVFSESDATTVTAQTIPIYTVSGVSGTIVGIDVACTTAPTGGDLAFTVDLQVGDVSTALATTLSAPVSYSATQSDLEVESGAVTSATLVDGDTLALVIAVSGSTGTQGSGLVVTVTIREDAV